jgi:succinyl-diaminopimelate desuccinylase
MLTRTAALAAELIARPSLTPDDAGCQEILGNRLAALGFTLEALPSKNVLNLWAVRGRGGPLLCFAGHTDVVPTGPRERWLAKPFAPTVREGRLYGRGAADMKSSLAAFVTAAEDFVTEHPRHSGRLAFLLTSDEEGAAVDGTVRVVELLKARGEHIDYCIVGEPTAEQRLGDMIKNGRRGSLNGRLVVHGVQGHVAYPALVQNPIHLVAPALAELAGSEWDRGDEYFPPTSFQVSNIHGGTGAVNVVPGSVEILFNFRHGTASSRESLQERVETVLRRHQLDFELSWPSAGRPFLTPRGSLVAAAQAAIQRVTGVKAALSCTGGTSDGRFLIEICTQLVEIGPVNASIHTVNENVGLDEIDGLHGIYLELMRTLLPSST